MFEVLRSRRRSGREAVRPWPGEDRASTASLNSVYSPTGADMRKVQCDPLNLPRHPALEIDGWNSARVPRMATLRGIGIWPRMRPANSGHHPPCGAQAWDGPTVSWVDPLTFSIRGVRKAIGGSKRSDQGRRLRKILRNLPITARSRPTTALHARGPCDRRGLRRLLRRAVRNHPWRWRRAWPRAPRRWQEVRVPSLWPSRSCHSGRITDRAVIDVSSPSRLVRSRTTSFSVCRSDSLRSRSSRPHR